MLVGPGAKAHVTSSHVIVDFRTAVETQPVDTLDTTMGWISVRLSRAFDLYLIMYK